LAWASAPAIESSDRTTACSFCGRSDRETFIRAIGAVICNSCVKSASATASR
jgi:recombinational DNA repair protein (RecF pathway)